MSPGQKDPTGHETCTLFYDIRHQKLSYYIILILEVVLFFFFFTLSVVINLNLLDKSSSDNEYIITSPIKIIEGSENAI